MRADTLLSKAVAGCEESLSALLKTCGHKARSSISGRIPQRWQSVLTEDDVMQVTYLSAFTHIDEFRSGSAVAFTAWLTRIARNNLSNALKELSADKRPNPLRKLEQSPDYDSSVALFNTMAGPDSTPSRRAGRSEIRTLMENAIAQLPMAYRSVVTLCDLEGKSVRETAEKIGRSEGAVYMLRARAHDRLRQLIGSASSLMTD